MKKSTNLIYYVNGCYGTFVEWTCNFFSKGTTDTDFPFTNSGSSHLFLGNMIFPTEKIKEYVDSAETYQYARCHPLFSPAKNNKSQYDESLEDLIYLSENFKKILVLYSSVDTAMWQQHNDFDKCGMTEESFKKAVEPYGYNIEDFKPMMTRDSILRVRLILEKELDKANIKSWGKNTVEEFDLWELRELLSLYWFDRYNDRYSCWDQLKKDFPNIKFICIDEFNYNFQSTILDYLNYFEVSIDTNKLDQISSLEKEWRSKQHHIDKDNLNKTIVDCLTTATKFDWADKNITFFDEVYIQKCLADRGIQIKCHNLNKFPTNTTDFLLLLERKI